MIEIKKTESELRNNTDFICVLVRLEQYRCDPVNGELENVHQAFGSGEARDCGVLTRDGVFYAKLKLDGQEQPMEVALHGVRSEIEARLALASLSAFGPACSMAI